MEICSKNVSTKYYFMVVVAYFFTIFFIFESIMNSHVGIYIKALAFFPDVWHTYEYLMNIQN